MHSTFSRARLPTREYINTLIHSLDQCGGGEAALRVTLNSRRVYDCKLAVLHEYSALGSAFQFQLLWAREGEPQLLDPRKDLPDEFCEYWRQSDAPLNEAGYVHINEWFASVVDFNCSGSSCVRFTNSYSMSCICGLKYSLSTMI